MELCHPRCTRAGCFSVFATNGDASVSGFSRGKTRLDAAIKASNGGAALDAWALHDIRCGVASGLARIGVNLPVIERCLNHVSGSFGGIVGVYQRHDFAEAMRDAISRWGLQIERFWRAASRAPTWRRRARRRRSEGGIFFGGHGWAAWKNAPTGFSEATA